MPAAVALETIVTSPKPEVGLSQSPLSPQENGCENRVLLNQRYFNVEAQKNDQSTSPPEPIREAVASLIQSMESLSLVSQSLVVLGPDDWATNPVLKRHVEKIVIPDLDHHRGEAGEPIDVRGGTHNIHVYSLHEAGPVNEQMEGDDELAAANHFLLPSKEFDGLWESLVYDSNVKLELLNYASTALRFSEASVDANVVANNRVVLLHGPPGTGKTSLCKALAQKLAIQFSGRYALGQLVEINSHSLFSKWFSESGKLVMKMFQNVEEFLEDPSALVFLLIDEVESLTAARKAAANGNEPSDAIRVVNALLTQIDSIKRHPNVFILTTSNLTGAIDLAFVDRADIKQFIGPPSKAAIASIYASSIGELIAKGLIDIETSERAGFLDYSSSSTRLFTALEPVALASCGFSGRTLRKLPFIAFAIFIPSWVKPTLNQFVNALDRAVQRQMNERSHFSE